MVEFSKSGFGPKNARVFYSKCSSFLMFATESGVKVYSARTGMFLHTLDSRNNQEVPVLVINKHAEFQVYSCYKNGQVLLHDFKLGILVKNWILDLKIDKKGAEINLLSLDLIACHPSDQNYLITSCSKSIANQTPQKPDTVISIIRPFNLRNLSFEGVEKRIDFGLVKTMYFYKDKQMILLMKNKPNHYYLYDIGSNNYIKKQSKEQITSLAFHPTENCIAIGDVTGAISLIYNFDTESPTISKMHWHASKVTSLEFTDDGVYLLSGGLEATLVLWQLSTGYKQFVPRFNSYIQSITISPNQSQYCLTLGDNSLVLLSSTDLKPFKIIAGVKSALNNISKYPMTVKLQMEPKTQALVFNGSPSKLQFISLESCETIRELDLSIRNRVQFGSNTVLQPHVKFAKFSSNGKWLVTVDERDAPEFPNESFLKFWEFNEENQEYILKTRVDSPHKAPITSITICPLGNRVVSTSRDKTFKIWYFIGDTWVCKSVNNYKSFVPTTSTFSPDGSLLALGFKSILTLWDPKDCVLVKTINTPLNERVIDIVFYSKTPHFAVISNNFIHVVNLLTCKVLWSLKIQINGCAMSTFENAILVSSKGLLTKFGPTSPLPLESIEIDQDLFGFVIFDVDSYACLDKNFEIIKIAKSRVNSTTTKKAENLKPVTAKSLFGSIYGSELDKVAESMPNKVASVMGQIKDFETLMAPSHIIANPTKLSKTFLESLFENLNMDSIQDLREEPVEDQDFEMEADETLETVIKVPDSLDFLDELLRK